MSSSTAKRRHHGGRTRFVKAVGGGIAVAGLAEIATYRYRRDWCVNWGATESEAAATLRGDEFLAEADTVTTRAIAIQGSPDSVWPWLAQMGSGRGGLYTYDWIENLLGLNMYSATEVLSEFQDVAVGDSQSIGPNGPTFRVVVCDPGEALVFCTEDGNWVWAFVLRRDGNDSRLISRNRFRLPGASAGLRMFYRYFMEPGSLIMERKMLLGIKQRVERSAPSA